MADPSIIRPFRWNVARRAELGSLVLGPPPAAYPGFDDALRRATALSVARAGDGALVFVGRSLEAMFDYLSGLTADLADAPTLKLLQVSLWRVGDLDREASANAAAIDALLGYLRAEGLSASQIAGAPGGVTFIDIVSTGQTFGMLTDLLRLAARRDGADWHAIERRIGFVGLVDARHTSPKTWRWWQREAWVASLKKPRIANVSIPGALWGFLGNNDEKATPSHHLHRWCDPRAAAPSHAEEHLKGLRSAVANYDRGLRREERQRFAAELARLPEMRHASVRRLVVGLRRSGGA
jgi:hypothetical protein